MKKKIILGALIVVFSCTKEESNELTQPEVVIEPEQEQPIEVVEPIEPSEPTVFDRGGLLINWADNIILPAYDNFNDELLLLKTAVNAFTTETNLDNLLAARVQWLEAYKAWQHIEMFNIGKAEEIYFNNKMNIYPTNIDRVENNIATASYDLNDAFNFSAQGFPALDYMLHGLEATDTEIVDRYTSDSKNADYLLALTEMMVNNTATVKEAWSEELADFKASTENTATSSLNKMTNDFIYYYEKGLRTNKIGIPSGIFSGSPLPGNVEGYYSKTHSKVLAKEALLAVTNFFSGKAFGLETEGESFKTYLDFLNSTKNGDDLSTLIISKFENAETKIDGLNDNFYDQVENDNLAMLVTFDALQEAVVLLKVDMLQALTINVDYVDADGD